MVDGAQCRDFLFATYRWYVRSWIVYASPRQTENYPVTSKINVSFQFALK